MIYAIPFMAFVLLIADVRITAGNMNVAWNGYGCVADVVRGRAQLPMQYRVFVPWLTWILGGSVLAYFIVKYLGIAFMLYSFMFYLNVLGVDSTVGVLALAAFLPITIMFDYADGYWELGFMAMAFALIIGGYSLWMILIVTFMGALNRETMVVIPIIALVGLNVLTVGISVVSLLPMIAIAFSFFASIATVRLIYGKKQRYCPLNLIKTNLRQMRSELPNLISGYLHMFLIAGGTLYAVNMWISSSLTLAVPLTIIAVSLATMIPGKWNEVRIFMPLSLVIIPALIQ